MAYERFLGPASADVAPATRLLAWYRRAGLLERLGRAAEALAAYRAALAVEADDDYSRQLKAKAKAKAEELGGRQSHP